MNYSIYSNYGRRRHVQPVALAPLTLLLVCSVALTKACSSAEGPVPRAPDEEQPTPSRGSTAEFPPSQVESGTACGSVTCKANEICCNESCGICAPPGGVCTQQFCGVEVDPLKNCGTDEDCRLYSDYCAGCTCRALTVAEPEPSCKFEPVQCLVDPCDHHEAACIDHRCEFKTLNPQ